VDKEDKLHTAEGSNPILLTAWVGGNADLVQEFPTFYRTLRFITVLTTARHLSLSSARQHQFLSFDPLNAELNPICHLLALLGGATIVVVSRLMVNLSTVIFLSFLLHSLQTCFISSDAHSTNPHALFFQTPSPALHATSSSRRLSKRCPVTNTHHAVHLYVIFFSLLLLVPSEVQMSSKPPYSKLPQISAGLVRVTKFHTRI
jgi:hypothetical protein